MSKARVLSFFMLATATLILLAYADSDGRTGYSGDPAVRGGASCEVCHSGGSAPAVDLTGPMTVAPGSTNTYTLTISGGQAAWGGLDVSGTLGTLAATDGGTRLMGGEIIHNAPRAADSNGDVTFTFDWTAPASAGSAALYAAGLSADGDGSDSGDDVGRMALMISVQEPTQNQPPVADPGGPYSATVGTTVDFDGSGSFDPDGTVTSYAWDFGDGVGVSTLPMPSYAYATPGNYTVELTVTDDAGATGSMTTVANISDTSPGNQTPVASAGGPYSGLVGTPITFDGSGSVDPDGTITSYVWDFGDGSNGSGVSVTHAYASTGAYTVTLTVTDDQAATASGTSNAVVTDQTTSSLIVLLRAPPRVMVRDGGEGRNVKVWVAADTSSLPAGASGCGTVTLFKNGLAVATGPICIHDDDDGDDDEEDEEEGERSGHELRVKTPHGVVALSRPTEESWVRARFGGIELNAADAPSVIWTAQVELMDRFGEASPVTTHIRTKTR